MAHLPSRTLRVPGTIDGAREGLEALDAFARDAGLAQDDVWQLHVALDEWLTNVARHAYRNAADGTAEIALSWDGHEVAVEVADHGPAFDPLSLPPPDTAAPIEARAPGGLGVYFIVKLMTRVAYRREGGRNVLAFALAVPRRPAGTSAAPAGTKAGGRAAARRPRTGPATATPRRARRPRHPR